MATLTDEAMDSYMYSAYTPYPYRYLNPKSKAASWRQRNYLANYAAADNGEYFDNYQRAQLKAILSQVNPNLTPRLRKANTRDVGVQVNPRQDASVQCSLGPRTLSRRRRGLVRREQQQEPELPVGTPASVPPKTVRFRRTIAVYSPVASRRLTTTFQEKDEGEVPEDRGKTESAESQGEQAATPEQRLAEAASGDWPEETGGDAAAEETGGDAATEESGDAAEETSGDAAAKSGDAAEETGGDAAAEETSGDAAEKSGDTAEKAEEKPDAQPEEAAEDGKAAGSGDQQAAADKSRVRFQFLEQKYGYYHCKECNIRWESAYVWCVQGTNKVYFRQFCRACQKTFNPYRVEDITCQALLDHFLVCYHELMQWCSTAWSSPPC